ncbi:hypothetical protein ACFSC6_22250 [Rufibacter sediminis]|uniref:Uncharacterized protein n=1 Tax=Rufibacter sediminis TaxID=2762756 RepID=A0ABR6VVL7_9BACT|nr:hypothetical protein [Rufibacter sediminis]MBC3540863.1 hypothetical protein [Rufibacter sediminis]
MKLLFYGGLLLFLGMSSACSPEQKGTNPTTDTDTNTEGAASPTAATSSAGSSGMGGAVSTHAIASDTVPSDSARRP